MKKGDFESIKGKLYLVGIDGSEASKRAFDSVVGQMDKENDHVMLCCIRERFNPHLGEKIAKFGTDYSQFISMLEETETHACGDGSGNFLGALQGAHTQLGIVRDDITDIKNFYRNTIKADINDLRSQKTNE